MANAPVNPRRRNSTAGVTLVEVLVALVLFALIGGAGFSVLDQVIRVQNLTEGRLQRLAQVQRAMHVVSQDFMQVSGGSLDFTDAIVSFRRSAGTGDMAVRYGLEESTLVRSVSGADARGPARQALLSNVARIGWRFFDPGSGWVTTWPPNPVVTTRLNPAAVALEVQLTGLMPSGDLPRIVILPADPAR